MKSHKVTQKHIQKIKDSLDYFEEVVLVTPNGSFFLYGHDKGESLIGPARCDERLYIHGVFEDPEHK